MDGLVELERRPVLQALQNHQASQPATLATL
jgi:hypothetical protein